MPFVPHVIDGIVRDENDELKEGVMVTVTNFRTSEGVHVNTNISGEYILDLANLPSGYEDKDVLLVQAYINDPPEKYADAILTCDTDVDSQTQNLTLKLVLPIHSIRALTDKEFVRTIFSPTTRAVRIIPVDTDGTMYHLIAKKNGDSWDLVLPDGTKFGEFSKRGNEVDLKITGDFSAGETFS